MFGDEPRSREERAIDNAAQDISGEVRVLREEIRGLREEVIYSNTQRGWTQGIITSVSGSVILANLLLFAILVVCISVANKIAPTWWHTPWWP